MLDTFYLAGCLNLKYKKNAKKIIHKKLKLKKNSIAQFLCQVVLLLITAVSQIEIFCHS